MKPSLSSISLRIANVIFPKTILLSSPAWIPPHGEAYDWFSKYDGWNGDASEAIIEAINKFSKLVEKTGCKRYEKDPGSDPDKSVWDCPNLESYNKFVELLKSSRFKAKLDKDGNVKSNVSDIDAFIYFMWKNHEIKDFQPEKGYKPEHTISINDIDVSQHKKNEIERKRSEMHLVKKIT